METPSNRTYTYCDSKLNPKCNTMTSRNVTEPRSTAYYYADLERFRRKTDQSEPANPDELSEYVEANDVINDGPIREVPPLRDRLDTTDGPIRDAGLRDYPDGPIRELGLRDIYNCNSPENRIESFLERKGETYSTAGTFPMPETKEKEPLLCELEVVGRLPLTQLEGSVRRSRSWYLCCPNVGEEEVSRESSWRYSSLRPVTAPPRPGHNGLSGVLVASQSSGRTEDVSSLKAERDALARALTAERARAASAARAHDARLAELHGVIAELVRRRAGDKQRAIPEEEPSDECESTTQPAGELEPDATETVSPSILSPDMNTSQETPLDGAPVDIRVECSPSLSVARECEQCDTSLNLSEKDSEICGSTGRCRQVSGGAASGGSCERERGGSCERERGGSCERERGSSDAPPLYTATPSPGRSECRQAKLASRVKLKRTDEEHNNVLKDDESWCVEAAEQLALDVCAQADLREALLSASNDGATLTALLAMSRARCERLQADVSVLECALSSAADTQHRLYCACCVLEQRCVSLCAALRGADRALETYDVLLALCETTPGDQRGAVELVARQLLCALEAERAPPASIHEPLLSRGPWLHHDHQTPAEEWSPECEARLREHAARLKAETVSLRPPTTPTLFSFHDIEEPDAVPGCNSRMQDMEAAVMMQEVLEAREAAAARALHAHTRAESVSHAHAHTPACHTHKDDTTQHKSGRRRARRHWLETHASETDL